MIFVVQGGVFRVSYLGHHTQVHILQINLVFLLAELTGGRSPVGQSAELHHSIQTGSLHICFSVETSTGQGVYSHVHLNLENFI